MTNKPSNEEKYKNAIGAVIMQRASEGDSVPKIAELLCISRQTFYKWLRDTDELSLALQQGKEQCADMVEVSLFKRAMGFFVPEEKVFCHEGMVTTHTSQRFVPPCTVAIKYCLNNLRSDKWSDAPDMRISDDDTITLNWKPKSLREADNKEQEDIDALIG